MLPLEGKRILVTRESQQAKPLSDMIAQRGGISVEIPLLVFQRTQDQITRQKLEKLAEFEWIVFTSSNGVHHFFNWMKDLSLHKNLLSSKKFAAVGSKTAQSLEEHGFEVDLIPEFYTGKELGDVMSEYLSSRTSLFVVQGNLAKQTAAEAFEEQGHRVETVTVYETRVNVKMKGALQQELRNNSLDILTFTSPSTVRAFCSLGEDVITEPIKKLTCLCIGPTTEEEAKGYGFHNIIVPDTYSIEGMIEVLTAQNKD